MIRFSNKILRRAYISDNVTIIGRGILNTRINFKQRLSRLTIQFFTLFIYLIALKY